MLSSRYWSTSKALGSESSMPTSVITEPELRAFSSWPDDVAHSDLAACLSLGLEDIRWLQSYRNPVTRLAQGLRLTGLPQPIRRSTTRRFGTNDQPPPTGVGAFPPETSSRGCAANGVLGEPVTWLFAAVGNGHPFRYEESGAGFWTPSAAGVADYQGIPLGTSRLALSRYGRVNYPVPLHGTARTLPEKGGISRLPSCELRPMSPEGQKTCQDKSSQSCFPDFAATGRFHSNRPKADSMDSLSLSSRSKAH